VRRALVGFVVGFILATVLTAQAATDIRLFVDGQEVVFPKEAQPQIINGWTMIPARPLAEALGATVTWDSETRSVKVTSQRSTTSEIPTLKINGEDTRKRFWLDDDGEPMVYTGTFAHEILSMLYPEGCSFLPTSGKIFLGKEHPQGRTDFVEVRVEIKENTYYVSMADAQAKGILRYTWDSSTNNLTVRAGISR